MSGPQPIAVVTGASGLLGGNLVAALVARGYAVRATRRRDSRIDHLRHLPIDWRVADLGDPAALADAFAGADAVFHCAGSVVQSRWMTPDHRAANIAGVGHVIAAVRAARVARLVHCSSVVTCAISTDGRPVDETQPWNFPAFGLNDGYARSKREGEALVLAAARDDVDAVVVNPSLMFGPLDAKPSSGQLILASAQGLAVTWPGGENNIVDVRDVAQGMIAALSRGRRGERYILAGENLPYRAILAMIADALGIRPPVLPLPFAVAMAAGLGGDLVERATGVAPRVTSAVVRYGYCRGYRFSAAKAERELGFAARSPAQAIGDAVAWLRGAGMLR